jgi:tetratricopeptide (TPR) repeat protein
MSPFGRIFGRGRQIENLLKKAEEAFGHKDWKTAIETARELRSRVTPGDSEKHQSDVLRSYYLEASAYHKLGEVSRALDIIDTAFQQHEAGLGDIARVLGEVSKDTNDPKAIEILQRASDKLPDNNHVALALCEKYVESEKFDAQAFPVFTHMHQRVPDNRDVIFGLAKCLLTMERYDSKSLPIYRRAFHEFSTSQDFLYALAKSYSIQESTPNEALPVIERALKFFPDDKAFQEARITILSSLPSLTPEQINMLVVAFKKSKDKSLAEKLVGHLLSQHADSEDACRVYEAIWREHPKRTQLLSILAEKYRLAGRRDPQAVEVLQAFFDDMPRERENTLYLARMYAEKGEGDRGSVIVYQQALRDGSTADLDKVIMALAGGYLTASRWDEEAARIYRMAHKVEPENYHILRALKDVALAGGRMDGPRADPLVEYITHPGTAPEDGAKLAAKLGPSMAAEERVDQAACNVYRLNVINKNASETEEALLAQATVDRDDAKLTDIVLLERVYSRSATDKLGTVLAELYREAGRIDKRSLPVILDALRKDPGNRKLASWALPNLLQKFGDDAEYYPLLAELIAKGHLSSVGEIKNGLVASTVTSIARDMIEKAEFRSAISVLSEAFKFEPNPILQYLLGVSYQGSGDLATGLGIFKDLLKVDKENPAYIYRSAVMKLMGGDLRGAEKELALLQAKFPDHPLVHLRLGMLEEAQHKPKEALAEYEAVKARDKAVSAFADYRKGILKCSLGDWKGGLDLLEKAIGGGVRNQTLETSRLTAATTLADRAIESGDLDTAEKLLNPIKDTKTPPWTVSSSERFLRLGLKRLIAGDEKGAQKALEASERLGARDSRVASLLALIDLNASRPKAAVERLEGALTSRDRVGAELAHHLWCVFSLLHRRLDEATESADWLIARKVKDAVKLRFLTMWRNPVEVDWPPALDEWTYDQLENELGFPVALVGRMAYKRADYVDGAKYLEIYLKDQKKPDRVEAEFLLGLMYIKQKKANLGLHYWSHILQEGYKELAGRGRIDALMLLGYHFLEYGEPDKSREAFELARLSGAEEGEIENAISLSHLQAGYLAAKSDNMQGATREWEYIVEQDSQNWQALQNLAIAYFWQGNDDKSLDYFDMLYSLCERKPELIDPQSHSFLQEETRKMVNQLVSLKQTEPTRASVKREMMMDEVREANRHYWTLAVKKGVTTEYAQANYFRLVKIYNPEKYPQEFMVLEKAYEFFNKPGLLKKNEQKVFNAFHFRQLHLEGSDTMGDIPPSLQVAEFLKKTLMPRDYADYSALLEDSMSRKDAMPHLNKAPDFSCPDYLVSW